MLLRGLHFSKAANNLCKVEWIALPCKVIINTQGKQSHVKHIHMQNKSVCIPRVKMQRINKEKLSRGSLTTQISGKIVLTYYRNMFIEWQVYYQYLLKASSSTVKILEKAVVHSIGRAEEIVQLSGDAKRHWISSSQVAYQETTSKNVPYTICLLKLELLERT